MDGFEIRRSVIRPDAVVIHESELLVDRVEDWSEVRSPSRAARRRRQGHPQRIRMVEIPKREIRMVDGVMYAHPVVAAEIRAKVRARGEQLQRAIDAEVLRALTGSRR